MVSVGELYVAVFFGSLGTWKSITLTGKNWSLTPYVGGEGDAFWSFCMKGNNNL